MRIIGDLRPASICGAICKGSKSVRVGIRKPLLSLTEAHSGYRRQGPAPWTAGIRQGNGSL